MQDFLPDFLTGFLLLNRSGLDAHERANILAAIRGEFSVKTVEKALKEQWRDDDLAKRDRTKQYANYVQEEDDDDDEEGLTANVEAPNPTEDPQGYEAFMGEQVEIDMALEAIKEKKRTLTLASAAGEDEPQVLSTSSLSTIHEATDIDECQSFPGDGEVSFMRRASQDLQLSSQITKSSCG